MSEQMTYDQTMKRGADQYRDVLAALGEAGLDAQFTQTGGMCAALEVMLDGGYHLLLTDRDDTLSWDRSKHVGWAVSLYEPTERETIDGPLAFELSDDGSPSSAVRLAQRVLREAARG